MKKLILSALSLFLMGVVFSQNVGIGTNTPHPSAQLDVTSNSRGFLPPRMTFAERNAIANPAPGLIIWCTDCLPKGEVQVFNGTDWTNMTGEPAAVNYVQLESITIGSQIWTSKNLDVVKYRNGDPIPKVIDPSQWSNLTTGAWCWYNNDSSTYAATFGRLYNFYAIADPRGLCPTGWHVSTNFEWTTLTNTLGGISIAGGALKSTAIWLAPNTGASNSSGFTGLPGGNRNPNGNFYDIIGHGAFWTSTEFSNNNAWNLDLSYDQINVDRFSPSKKYGFSVRCVRN